VNKSVLILFLIDGREIQVGELYWTKHLDYTVIPRVAASTCQFSMVANACPRA
jgi:hypothetical protein